MVDGIFEMRDRRHGWRAKSDLEIKQFRGSGVLRGRHAFTISDAGITVHPRIARPPDTDSIPFGSAKQATAVSPGGGRSRSSHKG